MLKRLRGRNLAHPGCLVGITTGLTLGIVLAAILASVFNVALNTDLLIWFGLTLVLGAIGWVIGDHLSSKFPAVEDELTSEDKLTHEAGLAPVRVEVVPNDRVATTIDSGEGTIE